MTIQEQATKLKYIKNNLEITLRLTKLLNSLYEDDYLQSCLLLKGGAATQLYLANPSRLFFDLDIDFAHSITERKKFKEHLLSTVSKQGYTEVAKKSRFSYSLDSYQFPYYLENGNLNYLKMDINYSFGSHLYPIIRKQVTNADFNLNQTVSLVNIEELLGMKIKAFQDRGEVKDLFDIYQLLNSGQDINIKNVQNAYLFYMVLADCQAKITGLDKITSITNNDVRTKLYPLIPKESSPSLELFKKDVLDYVRECNILSKDQQKFIQAFANNHYQPEYLFNDSTILEKARNNPIAIWKVKLKKPPY